MRYFLLLPLLLLTCKVYGFESKINVSKEEFKAHHTQLINVLMEQEKTNNYSSELLLEGSTSSYYFSFPSFIIANAYAASNMCFFGGWPSYKKSGKCKTPWKFQNDSDLKSLGPTYNSKHYCRSDYKNAENLYRCNPTLFGDAPSGKGLCVKLSSYNDFTKTCFEKTRDRIDQIYEKYKSDKTFRSHYKKQANSVREFCKDNKFSACRYLLEHLSDIQNKICEEQKLEVLNNDVRNFISKALNPIGNLLTKKTTAPSESLRPNLRANKKTPKKSLRPVTRRLRETSSSQPICKHFNRFASTGVPIKALKQALKFYDQRKRKFKKQWISIADYTDNSRKKRFYMFNVSTGEIRKHKVSHGSGHQNGVKYGDGNHDGNLNRCSRNGNRTNMTRPGFFKVSEPYYSPSHPTSWPSIGGGYNGVRMDGLSGSLNDHARRRGVVMHGANYNRGSVMGRSYGCPAFKPNEAKSILNTIKGGSLFYSYVGDNCSSDQIAVDRRTPNWSSMCN